MAPPAPDHAAPFVSVIMPVLNEARTLPACLTPLLDGTYAPDKLEVVVADGGSTDGTREWLAERASQEPRLRTVDNPGRTAPAGLNAALAAAKGQVVVRMDGHVEPEADYIARCVAALDATGADAVGGLLRARGKSVFGRAVALAMMSPFGGGPAAFRQGGHGSVDTVYLGAWRRSTLERFGGFDEAFARNQDYELALRIRRAGGTVWLDPSIRSVTAVRESPAALARQYFGYGMGRAATVVRHPGALLPRQLAPAALFAAVVALAAAALAWPQAVALLAAIGAAYLLAAAGAAVRTAGPRRLPHAMLVGVAFVVMHVSWGAGFWAGMARHAFDAAATGRRWAVPLGTAARRRVLVGGDVAVLGAVALLALRLGSVRSGWEWSGAFVASHAGWLAGMPALWMLLAWANGLYDPRRAPDRWMAGVLSAKVSAQVLLVWAVAYFVPPPWTLVRHVVVFFSAGAAMVMPAWRLLYASVLSRAAFQRRLLVVGAGRAGSSLVEAVSSEAPHEFQFVGFIDDDPALWGTEVAGVEVLGGRDELVGRALGAGASDIVLAVTRNAHGDLLAALLDAREQGVVVTPMPVFYEAVTGRVPVEHIGDHWAVALPLDPPESRGLYPVVRRIVDLSAGTVGVVGLVAAFPLLALFSLWGSPGPVMFRQVRIGRGGRPFTLWKLRTMVVNAEEAGPQWAEPADPRVTRGGRWLRRTRLDELPQAWNVLKGEMSLVGPRPERPEFVARLAATIPFYRARHWVRPGVTGWAQIHQDYAGSDEDVLLKLQYDLYYIKHQSLLLDLAIVLATVAAVARMRGR